MKVKDLLEGSVVDFQAARKQKATATLMDKLRGVAGSVKQHQAYENEASQELAMLTQSMAEYKKGQRLPGFDTLDDVFYYLVVDINVPSWTPVRPSEKIKPGQGGYEAHVGEVQAQQQKIRQWYKKLEAADQRKFQMIVHHVPRMQKALDTLHAALRKFQDKWWKAHEQKLFVTKLDAMDGATYLDTEIRRDKDELAKVQNVAEIIGL